MLSQMITPRNPVRAIGSSSVVRMNPRDFTRRRYSLLATTQVLFMVEWEVGSSEYGMWSAEGGFEGLDQEPISYFIREAPDTQYAICNPLPGA